MRCSVLVIGLLTVAFVHCSVKAPDLTLTGEKTALESQVLGTYEEIQNDILITASTRSVGTLNVGAISPQKQAVLDAVQNRKFNQDEIDEFKSDKVIGENNEGFLEILGNERYENDAEYRQLVNILVEEENRDRRIIYERVAAINSSAAQAGDEKLSDIFARLRFEESEQGTMIQMQDGTWVEKGKN